MIECTKCMNYGLHFKRNYKPVNFLEGHPSSKIWVIGLNPAMVQDWEDPRNEDELSKCFNDVSKIGSYFKDFAKVSPELFEKFGKEDGVAHTDIVKCSSKKWPPDSCKGKGARIVIDNCKKHLVAKRFFAER